MTPEVGRTYKTSRGLTVEIVCVERIGVGNSQATVCGYRKLGQTYLHVERVADIHGWKRVSE